MTSKENQIGNRKSAIGNESNRQCIRWGLIGCGDIARKRVAPALSESLHSELVAISRANRGLLDEFADAFRVPNRFADWRELVARDDVDAVYIATPVNLHAEQTVAAAESGKHVLCEKPMALNVAECDRMIAAANASGVKLGIAYYRQFYPVVKRMKDLIDSGEIGKPIVAQVNAFEWFNPGPSNPRAWLLDPEISGGGPMFDFGCHRIQLLLHLLGRIKAVIAVRSTALFQREVEDTASASFEFTSGAIANVTVSHAVMDPRDSVTIWGSEGSITTEVLNEGRLLVRTRHKERFEIHEPARNIHLPLIQDFVWAVIDEHQPLVTSDIGKAVAEVEEEIYRNGC
jgi:predicted dehydrogenase